MRVFYICEADGSQAIELDDLIDNMLASDVDIDPVGMRASLEKDGWYTAVHDHGPYLVLDLDHYWGRMQ